MIRSSRSKSYGLWFGLVAAFGVSSALGACSDDEKSNSRDVSEPGGAGGQAGAPAAGGASGGQAGSAGSESAFLDDPSGPLPTTMTALGLYEDVAERREVHPRAHRYAPRYALWTNGSDKDRLVVLPRGATIDSSDADDFAFPEGTLFFKTFSYPDESQSSGQRPIETRVLRKTAEGFDYAVYLWNQSGAELADIALPTPVSVTVGEREFDHTVPSRLQCRQCHESHPRGVLGFDALRLSEPLSDHGEGNSQLAMLFAAGVLSDAVTPVAGIDAPDELTQSVLGYFEGNCTHCHHGGEGANAAFDLRHQVALDALINQSTTSALFHGIRVVPGEPEESVLFEAISRESTQAMPPLGVDVRDDAAVEMIGDWIESLIPDGSGGVGGAGGVAP